MNNRKDMSFRQFIEIEEKPAGHFNALADELGIPPDEFEDMPRVSARVPIGKDIFNRTAWTIKKIVKDGNGNPTHAVVQMIPDPLRRKYQTGSKGKDPVHVPDNGADKERTFTVPIDKVQDLMTAPYASMAAGGMGGGDMGMGGGDMGMGMPPGGAPMM